MLMVCYINTTIRFEKANFMEVTESSLKHSTHAFKVEQATEIFVQI